MRTIVFPLCALLALACACCHAEDQVAARLAWTLAEPQRVLDPQQLRSVQVTGEAKTPRLRFFIKKAAWATF